MPIDQGRDLLPAEIVEPAAEQREALIGQFLDRRREAEAPGKPGLDRMLVGRLHVVEMAGRERADMARHDFVGQPVGLGRLAVDQMHAAGREHCRSAIEAARPSQRGGNPARRRPERHDLGGSGCDGIARHFSRSAAGALWRVACCLIAVERLRLAATSARQAAQPARCASSRQLVRRALAVDQPVEMVRMQIGLHAGRPRAAARCQSLCSRWRARARRDITVPIGTPVISAISL